jgi:putative glutamine amidotransferase
VVGSFLVFISDIEMIKDKPVIGIFSYGRNEENEFTLPSEYVDAVRAAGGLAVILPPGEKESADLLDVVDGLILSGGGDIDPKVYGGEDHPTNYNMDEERDRSELTLARLSLEKRFPTLGICRGTQLINIALGGDLVAHIPEVYGEKVAHRLPPRKQADHPVKIESASLLGQIVGQTEVMGRSWHHQALNRLGTGLKPVAWSADGVIEAVELENGGWLIAVQWHPELTAEKDPLQQRLFDSLVEEAGKRK